MLRKDDPAFKKVVDDAMTERLQERGDQPDLRQVVPQPIPPKGINLNVPMSAAMKKVVANPTDSGDPKDYQ